MNIHLIDTGYFKLDGGAMFGVVPKTIWNKLNPADFNNLCTWAMRCLLIEEGNRLVLIDTGIGNKQSPDFFKHYYLHGDATLQSSILKAGYSPDEVTDVFLTHLHFDHVGGALVRDNDLIVPAFKNAVYWTNEYHWSWAVHPNPREKASFLKENLFPLQESGQLSFVGKDSPFPFMEIFYADGHTEKQMLPLIQYKDKKLAYAADLIPSIAHIKIPYIMSYDIRPLQSMEEKQIFLEKAALEGVYLIFEHDPTISVCQVTQTDKGFTATPVDFSEIK